MKELTYKGRLEYRNKPENLDNNDMDLFRHEFKKNILDSYVLTLNHIYLMQKNLLGINKFKLYLQQSYMNRPPLKSILKVVLNFLKLSRKTTKSIDSGVWIINNKSENYFHWMTESLARVLSFQKLNKPSKILLSEQFDKYEFVSKTLDILDVEYTTYSSKNLIKVKKLFLTTHTAPAGNYNSEIILELQNKLNNNSISSTKKRLWLSRKYSDRRFLSNEDDICSIFEKYNIEIIYPEHFTYSQQIEIYRNAEFIGGVHGAALVNMLYMETNKNILELRGKNDSHNNCYYSLATLLNHKFYYQKCEIDLDDNFIVDPEHLNKTLKSIFKD
tara:strand:+ start:44980 stop:45969 length:990 start_codon:yes stop_codon:yes gene_type:complete